MFFFFFFYWLMNVDQRSENERFFWRGGGGAAADGSRRWTVDSESRSQDFTRSEDRRGRGVPNQRHVKQRREQSEKNQPKGADQAEGGGGGGVVCSVQFNQFVLDRNVQNPHIQSQAGTRWPRPR